MKVGRKPEYPEKTPATSFRKCHILKPENSSPKRDSAQHSSIVWQSLVRTADELTITPRVRPQKQAEDAMRRGEE